MPLPTKPFSKRAAENLRYVAFPNPGLIKLCSPFKTHHVEVNNKNGKRTPLGYAFCVNKLICYTGSMQFKVPYLRFVIAVRLVRFRSFF